jgi:diphthamide biosynthesis protein 3
MTENIYDQIEIEDMTYDKTLEIYHYPCPCGDRFEIGIADLRDGEDIAVCPSCSLMIRVIFEVVSALFCLALGRGEGCVRWRGAGNWETRSWEWLLTVAMQDDLPKASKDEKMEEQKAQVPVAT